MNGGSKGVYMEKVLDSNFDDEMENLQKRRAIYKAITHLEDELAYKKKELFELQEKINAVPVDDMTEEDNQDNAFLTAMLQQKSNLLNKEIAEIEINLNNLKHVVYLAIFDKFIPFKNIQYLLQKKNLNIGLIEQEAGCQPGYMSRLNKPNNTSNPSLEFLITASRILGVSLDVLLFVDLSSMSSSGQSVIKFLEKLEKDTIEEKLDWEIESSDSLNNIEANHTSGTTWHPLFFERTFMVPGETDYPDQVTDAVFESNTFGYATYIHDDCFNLKMNNGAKLYLMNVSKAVHKTNDPYAYAKEVWMLTGTNEIQFIASDRDEDNTIVMLVNRLFDLLKVYKRRPKLKKNVMSAIEDFLNDNYE